MALRLFASFSNCRSVITGEEMGLSLLGHGIAPLLHFSPRRPRIGDGRRVAVGVPHPSLNPISTTVRPSNFVSFITATRSKPSEFIASAGAPAIQTQSPLSCSTRTLRTLFSLSIASSVLLAKHAQNLALRNLPAIQSLRGSLSPVAGTLFFAARDQPVGYLNTPLTVVAAGLAKWLDIYSAVLMVRVLLSWFPNIPWDRQPLSAIRDLCDPYLNLFRNIIPPIFDTLDVSPLLAFAVLGTLGGILSNTRGL